MANQYVLDTAKQDFSRFISKAKPLDMERVKEAFVEYAQPARYLGAVFLARVAHWYSGMLGAEDLVAFWLLAKVEGLDYPAEYDNLNDAYWQLALKFLTIEEMPDEAA